MVCNSNSEHDEQHTDEVALEQSVIPAEVISTIMPYVASEFRPARHPLPIFTVFYSADEKYGANIFREKGQPLQGQADLKFVPVVKRFTIYGHLDSNGNPIHPLGTLVYTETLFTDKENKVVSFSGRATAYFDQSSAPSHGIPRGLILEWTNVSFDNALGLDSAKNFTSQGQTVVKKKAGHVNYSPTSLPKTGDRILVKVTTEKNTLTRKIKIRHEGFF